jgi:hypothetical protein
MSDGIEEKQSVDQVAKNAPEAHPSLYGRQGRVKPDPETNPFADLDCEKVPTWNDSGYFSPSVYVRSILSMPSASNCSPRLLHRRVSMTAIRAIRTLHATQS